MRERLCVDVRGAVQGVGFRPYVYRLATRYALDGWVLNNPAGVHIEVEGPHDALEAFLLDLAPQAPPRAVVQGVEGVWVDPAGLQGFEIRDSVRPGAATTLVLPDSATCRECRDEVFDPSNRRYRYPFTNCTNCGPRYSIIESLPYDRPRTSMRGFAMCAACEREYHNPTHRRFHAQPNACPECGPQVALWNGAGRVIASRDTALRQAADALVRGKIVAVKGLGGFHVMALASNEATVEALRSRKHRAEKPFAVMVSTLAEAEALCRVSAVERRLLLSAEAPIVLLEKRAGSPGLARAVAPGNPRLGLMMPYTPLHHVLLHDVGQAVVATSGNLADEPICIDEFEALERLRGIADLFLVHNRPIVRQVDDSVVRVQLGRELVLRRSRGYAPMPMTLPAPVPCVVAVGGHLKNTVAVSVDRHVFVSQHIGDLETPEAHVTFARTVSSLDALFGARPEAVAADQHPDYVSTHHAQMLARTLGVPIIPVQHHLAHVLAAAVENGIDGEFLGVAWDGTGLGTDHTIWGGEFLTVDEEHWQRVACLRHFHLPGGERAARDARRSAFGVVHALMGRETVALQTPAFTTLSPGERELWHQAIERRLNAPVTSSAGRLFDAVSALVGVRTVSTYEGQAAMELEWAVDPSVQDGYPWRLVEGHDAASTLAEVPRWVIDWAPAIDAVLTDVDAHVPTGTVAARWHRTMADVIASVAVSAGRRRVVLSGGCFQNVRLCEWVDEQLRQSGLVPYWHQRVPPNDGGLSLGQVMATIHPRTLQADARRSDHGKEAAPCV